ncbi:MAG: hypothetical protein EOP24_32050 [Hyphomicrobiales bacterium]|nr:MAG: hypothetical protein EOP24_32050 [Hyphomicrobiales bacterium]
MTRSPRVALLEGQAPPRVKHAPSKSTANSWEDAADLLKVFGVQLDEWQEVVLEAAMHERSDGRWMTRQVAISTPRQNGKSQLIVARALAGALLFGEKTIIVSAHQQDTAREVFQRILDLIDENPALAQRVAPNGIMRALNREYVKFQNGAVIRFKARSTGGGRGFSCDCLLLDEAQILGAAAWSSILPTMSARPNPQVWLLGTPPTPMDDGEVFTRVRASGIEGKQRTLAYLEWSAEPGDDFDSPETWARANPSYGHRIGEEAILAERASMTDEQFAMERLGIWATETMMKSLVLPDEWSATAITEPPTEGVKSFGVKFAADGSRVAVAGALKVEGGPTHVELIGAHSGSMSAGTAALVDWLAERWRDTSCIVVDGASHQGAFVNALLAAKVPERIIVTPSWPEVASGNAMLLDAIVTRQMTHLGTEGQQVLDDSATGTTKKLHGDKGAWSWVPINENHDAVPIGAAALAHYGARTSKRRPGQGRTSGRRAVVR